MVKQSEMMGVRVHQRLSFPVAGEGQSDNRADCEATINVETPSGWEGSPRS